jgi:hypothetical protein
LIDDHPQPIPSRAFPAPPDQEAAVSLFQQLDISTLTRALAERERQRAQVDAGHKEVAAAFDRYVSVGAADSQARGGPLGLLRGATAAEQRLTLSLDGSNALVVPPEVLAKYGPFDGPRLAAGLAAALDGYEKATQSRESAARTVETAEKVLEAARQLRTNTIIGAVALIFLFFIVLWILA